MFMLRKAIIFLSPIVLLMACVDQTPEVIKNPLPPKKPSDHILNEYFYVQFAVNRESDTVTYEVLDDTNSWEDSNYVNVVMEVRNEPMLDTTGKAAEEIEEPVLRAGWHYAPGTSMIKKKLYDYNTSDEIELDIEELEALNGHIFTMYFPYLIKGDTFGFWDFEDYVNNPSVKEGDVKWGRVGNNIYNDSVWNTDAQNGVVITYIDTAGVEWRSDNHPTFQPFGYFVLDEVIPNLRDGYSYNIIRGRFAVRLYNQFGEIKDFRGGQFRMRIFDDIELAEEPQ